ncbi:hypothetical protein NDU88_000911 [Pleurodeles waltl]|uniref:Uncharacterized protein n=1 Tax=Pleurodeles waltl TaxID=8319 RepID=A0AAV7Q2I3_PLEWA|nr:hypothetical protein NDU88_000911 [Pleurodeles waltl]
MPLARTDAEENELEDCCVADIMEDVQGEDEWDKALDENAVLSKVQMLPERSRHLIQVRSTRGRSFACTGIPERFPQRFESRLLSNAFGRRVWALNLPRPGTVSPEASPSAGRAQEEARFVGCQEEPPYSMTFKRNVRSFGANSKGEGWKKVFFAQPV